MATESNLERHKATKKNSLFRIFILTIILVICGNLYLLISGLAGNFDWTIEKLTSSIYGFGIQIISVVVTICGFILFVYVLIYIILTVSGSKKSD